MGHTRHDLGVSKHIGRYSDAVGVAAGARWFFTSGTPGISPDGTIAPDFATQATQTWTNVMAALADAGMDAGDIVKVTSSLLNAADIPAYAAIRASFLHDARPAFMLAVVQQLIRPDVLLEVEVVAAKLDR